MTSNRGRASEAPARTTKEGHRMSRNIIVAVIVILIIVLGGYAFI